MLENIYLHIGQHKTGTTAIQKFLKNNRTTLEEKHDLLYFIPKPFPLRLDNELEVKLNVQGFEHLSKIKQNNVVISNENYSWLYKEEHWQMLFNICKKYAKNVFVIYYVRRQDQLAVSQKQEGTKWRDCSIAYGHEISALPTKLSIPAKRYLQILPRYKLLEKTFERNYVKLQVYKRSKFLDNNVVKDFCFLLGIKDFSDFIFLDDIQVSISKPKQIFLHQTRPYFPERSIEKETLTKAIKSLKLEGDHEKLMPPRDEAIGFYNQFKDENIELNKYLTGEEKDLFDDDFSTYQDSVEVIPFDQELLHETYASVIRLLGEELHFWRNKDSSGLTIVDWLRDTALSLEKTDIDTAWKLMEKALDLRPNDPFIKRKLDDYMDIT